MLADRLLNICERIRRFREAGELKHIYMNELGYVYFPQDAAYSDSKDLARRTVSDKVLK